MPNDVSLLASERERERERDDRKICYPYTHREREENFINAEQTMNTDTELEHKIMAKF